MLMSEQAEGATKQMGLAGDMEADLTCETRKGFWTLDQ